MSDRTYGFLTAIVGVICSYVVIRHVFFLADSMTVRNDLVQGVLVGFGLAVVTVKFLRGSRLQRSTAGSPCSDAA